MNKRACEICGQDELIPFKCSYCGKIFCAEHRLPEKHNCSSQPKTPPPYAVEKIISSRFNKVLNELEIFKNVKTKQRPKRKGFFDKVEESRAYQILFFLIVIVSLASFFIVPDLLSHYYLKHIDFFRFHLAQIASFTKYATGTGWIIIGYGIPLLIPLNKHSLILCLEFYGALALLFVSYHIKGMKALILTFIILFSMFFVISENGRLSTSDFQTTGELSAFLRKDNTDKMVYTSDFTCIDFSLTLIERAKESGYRLYYVSDGSHALCEAYIVTNDVWLNVEPQTDEYWP